MWNVSDTFCSLFSRSGLAVGSDKERKDSERTYKVHPSLT